MNVKKGSVNRDSFNSFQHKRYQYLKRNGLKLIRLDNLSDKLSTDEKLMGILKARIEYLSIEGNYFVVFNLDDMM